MKRRTVIILYFLPIAILCVLLVSLTIGRFPRSLNTNSKVLFQHESPKIHKFKYEMCLIDMSSKKEVWYPVPKFAVIRGFRLLKVLEGAYRIEVETYSPIPTKTKEHFSFTAFFKYDGRLYGVGVTCGLGPSPYRSPAPSRFSYLQGGVFSYMYQNKFGKPCWIGPLKSAMIKGNKLILEFPSNLIQDPKKLHCVLTRYLPCGFAWKYPWESIADAIDFEFQGGKEVFYMTEMPPPDP